MIEVTLPIVRKALAAHRGRLLALAILGVLLGIVPTIKSELEAAVLDHITSALPSEAPRQDGLANQPEPSAGTDQAMRERIGQTLSEPLRRFSSAPDEADGIPESLARLLFRGASFAPAFGVYVVIAVVAFLLVVLSKRLQTAISRDVFASLRSEGLRLGLLTDPSQVPTMYSAANPAGQYASAIHQGASTVNATYAYLLEAAQHVFALATTLFLLSTKHPGFAGAAIILVGAQILISVTQARRLKEKRRELDARRNELVARTDDILNKREILVAYEQQDWYVDKLKAATRDYAEVDRQLNIAETRYDGLNSLVTDMGRVLILATALGLAYLFGGRAIRDAGDAFFLLTIYYRLFGPASNLLLHYDNIRRSESVARTFLDVLDAPVRVRVNTRGQEMPDVPRGADAGQPGQRAETSVAWSRGSDIRFSRVTFAYPQRDLPVLNDISFRIPAGKTTLLVGPSGSGKSTIARLLLGFWELRDGGGEIAIGGHSIHAFTPVELRAHMSYVAQGDHTVDETVRENLQWGQSATAPSDARMHEILSEVSMGEVRGYPNALLAPARALSGGQQQRLSVARMMLDESEIVIMDEPLSGVDLFTQRELLPRLAELFRNRQHTVLLISHRLAFAAFADHVIVMTEQGSVQEEGDPRTLLAQQGEFASLYRASVEELRWNEGPAAV